MTVSFEESLKLKELGYKWDEFYRYDQKGILPRAENKNWNNTDEYVSAPDKIHAEYWLKKYEK